MEKILADFIVVVHFLWIIFMLWEFCANPLSSPGGICLSIQKNDLAQIL